jgi:opacity protein-like surface antigen
LGLSLAYYPWEPFGFELDAELHGHFFRDEDVAGLATSGVDLDTQAALFSGSLVARHCWQSAAFGAWCPHATAGAGAIHPWFDAVAKMPGATSFHQGQTDPALTAGLGLTHVFTSNLGLRFDARYFRALVNASAGDGGYSKDYGFLRLSAGVSVGFR